IGNFFRRVKQKLIGRHNEKQLMVRFDSKLIDELPGGGASHNPEVDYVVAAEAARVFDTVIESELESMCDRNRKGLLDEIKGVKTGSSARSLQTTEGAVKVLGHRLRQKLGVRLTKAGIPQADMANVAAGARARRALHRAESTCDIRSPK